jgi:hypothetical protein
MSSAFSVSSERCAKVSFALEVQHEVEVTVMKFFLKYAAVAFGVQAILLFLLGLIGNLISPTVDAIFEIFLRIYEPIIVLIAKVGQFKGESAMIEPVWMGIAVGVLIYSMAFGFAARLFRKDR